MEEFSGKPCLIPELLMMIFVSPMGKSTTQSTGNGVEFLRVPYEVNPSNLTQLWKIIYGKSSMANKLMVINGDDD